MNNNLPQGWSSLPINEVFEFIGTSSFSRNDLNYEIEDDSIYYIHYGDIHATYKNAVLDFKIETRIPVLNKGIRPTSYFLKEGDLIIADASEDYEGVGEALEVYNIEVKKVLAGLHTFALRDKNNKTAHGYRAYLFKNPDVKKRLKTIATGSKVYGISKGNLEKFKITLPPLSEQQKIAKILATWDRAILLQQKLIANKKKIKNTVMRTMLSGEMRFKGFSDEWKELKLKEICVKKGIVRGPFGGALKKEIFVQSGYKVYEQKNAIYKSVEIGNYFVNEGKYNEMRRFSVKENDIIISCSGTIGAVFRIPKNYYEGIINQALLKLSIDCSSVDVVFFEHLLNSARVQSRITDSTQGGAMKNLIGTDEFRNLKFKIPSIDEQQQIGLLISAIEIDIKVLQNKLMLFKKQKQGLMQHLLTGKIRVK
jgi:type I restriction enzyme S subunit